MERIKLETTFLKGCEENQVFCQARLHIWNFNACSTDERHDDKQVVTQLSVKVTEALSHLVDECIAQLATSVTYSKQFADHCQYDKNSMLRNGKKNI